MVGKQLNHGWASLTVLKPETNEHHPIFTDSRSAEKARKKSFPAALSYPDGETIYASMSSI